MARGDQIYVMRPFIGLDSVYQHHGIDCGDGTVIHFRKGDEAVISRTSYETFARGNPVFVKTYSASYIPDVVIARAESRLGERQYNLLTNNCEHFATWCKTGQSVSYQLLDYGVDLSQLSSAEAQRLAEEVADEGDPILARRLFNQAIGNLDSAHARLQTEYSKAQNDVMTWDRVARLALERQREDLARVALERKVTAKRQAEKLLNQLAEVTKTGETIKRNSLGLNQQLTDSTGDRSIYPNP